MDDVIQKKLEMFFTQYKKQQFKKGEILIRADDDPPGIFYLQQGTVRMYLISRNGDEQVLNLFKPISFFPMFWGINGTQNLYYFEAMDDVIVWRASRKEVLAFLKNNSDVVYDLLARVYRGLDGVLTRMAYLMNGNAYTRLITELLIISKRFGKVGDDGIKFTITEKDLSASAGMTRETVSREMKVLKDKGLVTFQKNVLLVSSLEKLEKELEREF
ncbi:MAG TPA: Crp/Fnr family transcriptional regulator [Candidatus Acidoferrales bacterium]|nr:Crp/Fnr family transcriptional regulator [Candidatus Acidoferrales bacterium]